MARWSLPKVGHELDERIAVEVFGQKQPAPGRHDPDHIDVVTNGMWFCLPDYYQGDRCLWEPRHFSLYMRWAWKLVERMETLGFFPMVEKGRYTLDDNLWCALFKEDLTGLGGVLACASTPAHAICLAALDALKAR